MTEDPADRTSRLVTELTGGRAGAAEDLVPLVYTELRGIADRLVARQAHATLQPTELIHEAYVRLVHGDAGGFEGRTHFTRVAARAMRYVLVDRARSRLAGKRGGAARRVTLDASASALADRAEDVLFVHEGLERLASFDPQLAEIVEAKCFGGMTIPEIALTLGVSTSTVDRGWRLARAWWIREFGDS